MNNEDIKNLMDKLDTLTENKELTESMTEDDAIKEIEKLSKEMANLANNIGSSRNSEAYDAVISADRVLTDYLKKKNRSRT